MIVFRLTKARHALDLSGKGAQLNGGRWNSPGLPVVYTASHRSLSVLELLVHFPSGMMPIDFEMTSIEIPDALAIHQISIADLPKKWYHTHQMTATQSIGDAFLMDQKAIGCLVPSAIVPQEHNVLINPLHPAIDQIRIVHHEVYDFDDRLLK